MGTEVCAPGGCTFTTPVTTKNGSDLQISFVTAYLVWLGWGRNTVEARRSRPTYSALPANQPVDIAGGTCPSPPTPQPSLACPRERRVFLPTRYRIKLMWCSCITNYAESRPQLALQSSFLWFQSCKSVVGPVTILSLTFQLSYLTTRWWLRVPVSLLCLEAAVLTEVSRMSFRFLSYIYLLLVTITSFHILSNSSFTATLSSSAIYILTYWKSVVK
jgi:hypothetical protein